MTRYDTSAVDSGAIYGQVQQAYNRFAQLVSFSQEQRGLVGKSPTVSLSDANGSSDMVRPTGMDDSSGRELTE
jgi:hypothetical protein